MNFKESRTAVFVFFKTEAEKALILKLYQKKWSIEQIAQAMELDPLFIKQLVDNHPLS